MSKKVKKVKGVTFSEKCFYNKDCPPERPHCIKKSGSKYYIAGNCGTVKEFEKWVKKAYNNNKKHYDYKSEHTHIFDDGNKRSYDPGNYFEYDFKGKPIIPNYKDFINPLYEDEDWWKKDGGKKKRTRKKIRKKRRRTRKRRRRKKRRRTRK